MKKVLYGILAGILLLSATAARATVVRLDVTVDYFYYDQNPWGAVVRVDLGTLISSLTFDTTLAPGPTYIASGTTTPAGGAYAGKVLQDSVYAYSGSTFVSINAPAWPFTARDIGTPSLGTEMAASVAYFNTDISVAAPTAMSVSFWYQDQSVGEPYSGIVAVASFGNFELLGGKLVFGTHAGMWTGSYMQGEVVSIERTVLAPVPEPEAYAMLLAGLGLVCAIARRRRA